MITIDGKTYRTLPEQVEENAKNIAKIETDNLNIQGRINELGTALNYTSQRLIETIEDVTDLDGRVDSLEDTVTENTADIENLKTDDLNMQGSISELRNAVNVTSQYVIETMEDVAEIKTELDKITSTATYGSVTKDLRYPFNVEVGGITYTDADHSNNIVYGGTFAVPLTPEQLVDRTYYGWTFGTLGNSGYISITTPKTTYDSSIDTKIVVNFSWNVNNSDSTRPAINGAVIGIYDADNIGNIDKATYFDSYVYFGTITNRAFVGTVNSQGQYTETRREYDREGVLRDITYPAIQLTSWGQSSTTSVANNMYSGGIVLDISTLKAGNYKIMFVNTASPDWPIENIIAGTPYQILVEMPITII